MAYPHPDWDGQHEALDRAILKALTNTGPDGMCCLDVTELLPANLFRLYPYNRPPVCKRIGRLRDAGLVRRVLGPRRRYTAGKDDAWLSARSTPEIDKLRADNARLRRELSALKRRLRRMLKP